MQRKAIGASLFILPLHCKQLFIGFTPLLAILAHPQESRQMAQVFSYGNGVGVVLPGYDQ